MEKKQIDVTCPCCEARLQVDVLTSQVVRATAASEKGGAGDPAAEAERWEHAARRVEERSSGAEDKLEAALDAEKGKADRFDELFDAARERLREREDRELES